MRNIIAGMLLILATLSGCATSSSGVVKDAANVIGKLEQNTEFDSTAEKNNAVRKAQCEQMNLDCGSGAETRRDTLAVLREANYLVSQKIKKALEKGEIKR